MTRPPAHVVITPWASLEADCLRHLLQSVEVVPTRQVDENTEAYLLTVPRKLSPWPIELPSEIADCGIPVLLVVDVIVPWSIALGRSVGASGLVSWADPPATIVSAVHRVLSGVRPTSSRGRPGRRDPLSRLTKRERQVMALVTQGEHDEVIAARLGISVNTVRSHVQHCLTKLDVTHRHAAATLVRKGGQMRARQDMVPDLNLSTEAG